MYRFPGPVAIAYSTCALVRSATSVYTSVHTIIPTSLLSLSARKTFRIDSNRLPITPNIGCTATHHSVCEDGVDGVQEWTGSNERVASVVGKRAPAFIPPTPRSCMPSSSFIRISPRQLIFAFAHPLAFFLKNHGQQHTVTVYDEANQEVRSALFSNWAISAYSLDKVSGQAFVAEDFLFLAPWQPRCSLMAE
jgi:hypothetical protein